MVTAIVLTAVAVGLFAAGVARLYGRPGSRQKARLSAEEKVARLEAEQKRILSMLADTARALEGAIRDLVIARAEINVYRKTQLEISRAYRNQRATAEPGDHV